MSYRPDHDIAESYVYHSIKIYSSPQLQNFDLYCIRVTIFVEIK